MGKRYELFRSSRKDFLQIFKDVPKVFALHIPPLPAAISFAAFRHLPDSCHTTRRILLDPTLPVTIVPSIPLSFLGLALRPRSRRRSVSSRNNLGHGNLVSKQPTRIIISGPVLTVRLPTVAVPLWAN